ncbi:MAG: glycoside hydrolase family 57 protein [Spirochaetota bacterium]
MKHGSVMLVLHAHLPFVRHPEYDSFLEEMWLFEAISETYLPLLRMLDRLERDDIAGSFCMSFSPTLVSMLNDSLLRERYVQHLDRLIELGWKETDRTSADPELAPVAAMYRDLYAQCRIDFLDTYEQDLIARFRHHAESGRIQAITTLATHPFAPVYQHSAETVRVQIQVAIAEHAAVFGRKPKGFWLPECGYYPGIEQLFDDAGIHFFFVAAHGLLFGEERAESGVYAPVQCSNGVLAFGRDMASANAVWSESEGYPGDPEYREFYRDIGHDLPIEYIGPYIHLGNERINTGYKYYAITGRTDQKRPYIPERASEKALSHAENFLFKQVRQCRAVAPLIDKVPVIVSPYDAELFGHWWFEGVQWLEALFRRAHKAAVEDDDWVEFVSPAQYMHTHNDFQVLEPVLSSWGNKGYSEVWLDGSNDWIYRHTHKAVERMIDLVQRYPNETGLKQRALNQAAREVLLSQASDWPFIIRSGTAVSYAESRVKEHISNFTHIYDSLSGGMISTEWLTKVERRNNCFPRIDYRLFGRS